MWHKLYKHVKTQKVYELLHDSAALEKDGLPNHPSDYMVVYRCVQTGQVWVRPREEFFELEPPLGTGRRFEYYGRTL